MSHAYGDTSVLRDVSLEVASGEVYGLLGPNGSGKSTLLTLLTGGMKMGTGTVELDGKAISPTSSAYRRAIGVVFQSPALDAKLSCRENLELVATMYGYRGADAARRVDGALDLAGLADRAGDLVGTLSGGLKRRLDIGRALLPEPRLLFMDEPTTGLDEASFRALWSHLAEANRRRGLTIVVSTHRSDEAERCGRLCVIDRGEVVRIGSPAELKSAHGTDLVALTCAAAADVAQTVSERGWGGVRVIEDEVLIEAENGHALVPELFSVLPRGAVSSVAVREPSLADAYLALTGRSLDAPTEEAA